MANAREALNATFGIVVDAGTTISSTFNTATKSVGMLNKFVSDAAEAQDIRSVVKMETLVETILDEQSVIEAQRKETIATFISGNSGREVAFNEARARFKAALDNRKTK